MKKTNIYDLAYTDLNIYLEKNIKNYERLRNYDFGLNDRTNISNLSKYISHRILNEFELIKNVLSKYKLNEVEKFIQEVFWRIYWKGWLENRPRVWTKFIESLDSIKKDDNFKRAINSETDLKCFNEWVYELKTSNYLHNHTRMWFASIWIFTLKLPWQLGAEFFLQNLIDGDAASNTLSWRWVAGLQTKGKHYLAKSWNIQKYTNNRYLETKLNVSVGAIEENCEFKIEERSFYNNEKKNNILIILDNDVNLQSNESFFLNYEKIFLVFLDNEHRKIKLNRKVLDFKRNILKSFTEKINNSLVLDASQLLNEFKYEKKFDVIYPFIGENLEFMKKNSNKLKIELNFIHDKRDTYCKEFSKKGFFNFKKNIPKIINDLELIKYN